MAKLNKVDKIIVIPALCLIVASLGALVAYERVTAPAPTPTPTLDPELRRRADKVLSPQSLFEAIELKKKLRDREAFMVECEKLSRDELLDTLEQVVLLVKDCEVELAECKDR